MVDDAYSRPLLPKCHINEALPPRDYVLVAVDAKWMEWSAPAASESSPLRQEIMSIGAADFVTCGKGDMSDCFFQAALPADVVNMIEGGNVVAKEGNALKKLGIKISRDKGQQQVTSSFQCTYCTKGELACNFAGETDVRRAKRILMPAQVGSRSSPKSIVVDAAKFPRSQSYPGDLRLDERVRDTVPRSVVEAQPTGSVQESCQGPGNSYHGVEQDASQPRGIDTDRP